MPYAHVDRTNTFITDLEKLRPFSQAEATGLLAAMRMLDGQEPNTMSYLAVVARLQASDVPVLVYVSNIPGTRLGITYRRVGDRVQVLGCRRR
jgi:hypothetical protein